VAETDQILCRTRKKKKFYLGLECGHTQDMEGHFGGGGGGSFITIFCAYFDVISMSK
jgi:hypothetical protein